MQIVDKTVISGPHWLVVSAVGHYSSSATSAADTTNMYRLLIAVLVVTSSRRPYNLYCVGADVKLCSSNYGGN